MLDYDSLPMHWVEVIDYTQIILLGFSYIYFEERKI